MFNNAVMRRLGKVLLVEGDSTKAQLKVELLTGKGTSIDVVENDFQVLIRLGFENHGYNLVFLGNRPMYPDAARREVLEKMNLFD